MSKNNCSCGDDTEKEYVNEAPAFTTLLKYNNTFIPKFENPARKLRNSIKNNNIKSTVVDRSICENCDDIDNISTQDKLSVRKKDRPTPYRVPYNHFRKVTSCPTDVPPCKTNTKIIKDISCSDVSCQPVNYAISRLVDKNGVRNINNGGNYKNYLQKSGKTYYLNSAGILPENAIYDKIHTYKIGTVETTKRNIISNTQDSEDCQINLGATISLSNKSYTLYKVNTTTKKYSNPKFQTSGSVSSKTHIHRKKFKNILAGQSTINGYNNCINGEVCSLYSEPGPNSKLITSEENQRIQHCIVSRVNGIAQRCPPVPLTCNNTKNLNPKFQVQENMSSFDPIKLIITINHCKVKKNDIADITFTGFSTIENKIFIPIENTNISSYITESYYTDPRDNGFIILNISDIFVKENNIYWKFPIDLDAGSTTIIISYSNNESSVLNHNGSPGVIYANASLTNHPSVNSVNAFTIIPLNPCRLRHHNASFNNISFVSTPTPNQGTEDLKISLFYLIQ